MRATIRATFLLAILLAGLAGVPAASAHCPITPIVGTPASDQVQECVAHAVDAVLALVLTGGQAVADVTAIVIQVLADLNALLQQNIEDAEPVLQALTSIEFLVALFDYVRCRLFGPAPCIAPDPLPPPPV